MWALRTLIYKYIKSIGLEENAIDINTVDSYQGGEKDIIIFSCVRSNNH
jgi:superfamily I DNA and/or RNA helicase